MSTSIESLTILKLKTWKDRSPHGNQRLAEPALQTARSGPPDSQLRTRVAGAASNNSSSSSRNHGSCPQVWPRQQPGMHCPFSGPHSHYLTVTFSVSGTFNLDPSRVRRGLRFVESRCFTLSLRGNFTCHSLLQQKPASRILDNQEREGSSPQ